MELDATQPIHVTLPKEAEHNRTGVRRAEQDLEVLSLQQKPASGHPVSHPVTRLQHSRVELLAVSAECV